VRALADVLVLQNLDELFALELDEHMPFAAAPEIMPPDKFNTGVMVVKPSAIIYQKLLSAAAANEQPHDYDQVLLPASSSIGTFRIARKHRRLDAHSPVLCSSRILPPLHFADDVRQLLILPNLLSSSLSLPTSRGSSIVCFRTGSNNLQLIAYPFILMSCRFVLDSG
jgi:hypothetical protein